LRQNKWLQWSNEGDVCKWLQRLQVEVDIGHWLQRECEAMHEEVDIGHWLQRECEAMHEEEDIGH
jgi:hypothetical protein